MEVGGKVMRPAGRSAESWSRAMQVMVKATVMRPEAWSRATKVKVEVKLP